MTNCGDFRRAVGGDQLPRLAVLFEHGLMGDLDFGVDVLGGADGERALERHPFGLDAPARIGCKIAQGFEFVGRGGPGVADAQRVLAVDGRQFDMEALQQEMRRVLLVGHEVMRGAAIGGDEVDFAIVVLGERAEGRRAGGEDDAAIGVRTDGQRAGIEPGAADDVEPAIGGLEGGETLDLPGVECGGVVGHGHGP